MNLELRDVRPATACLSHQWTLFFTNWHEPLIAQWSLYVRQFNIHKLYVRPHSVFVLYGSENSYYYYYYHHHHHHHDWGNRKFNDPHVSRQRPLVPLVKVVCTQGRPLASAKGNMTGSGLLGACGRSLCWGAAAWRNLVMLGRCVL
jgi:hypothetical protein